MVDMRAALLLVCIIHAAHGHGSHAHAPSPPCDPATDNCESLPYDLAWGMNIGAAASTLIGAGAVTYSPKLRKVLTDPTSPVLVSLLSLSFGVLLWVSLVVLQPEAAKLLDDDGVKGYNLITSAIFFVGWGLGYLLQLAAGKVGAVRVKHDDTCVEFDDEDGDTLTYRLKNGRLKLLVNEKVIVNPVNWLGWQEGDRVMRDEAASAPIPAHVDVSWIKALADNATDPVCEWRVLEDEDTPDHQTQAQKAEKAQKKANSRSMANMACHTAMSLALHNFAEGFVSFVAVIADKNIGVATGIAIMLHNIPEGFVIAVPAWTATQTWHRPLLLTSFATGAEIVAGFIAWQVVRAVDDYSSDGKAIVWLQAVLSSLAAGIMGQAALGSLLPHCLEMEQQRRTHCRAQEKAAHELPLIENPAGAVASGGSGQGMGGEPGVVMTVGVKLDANPDVPCEGGREAHVDGDAEPQDDKSLVMGWALAGMVLMAVVLGLFDIEDF